VGVGKEAKAHVIPYPCFLEKLFGSYVTVVSEKCVLESHFEAMWQCVPENLI